MYKILIVDDETLLRNGLKMIIQRNSRDFQIIAEANNGIKALELIKIIKPHIVISDIRMPEMDGLELVRRIDKNNPDIIKVIVSGYGDFEYAQQAIQYKVYDYLLKPIKTSIIINLLEKLKRETEKKIKERYNNELDILRINGKISILYSIVKQEEIILSIETLNYNDVRNALDSIFMYMTNISIDIFHIKQLSLEILNFIINSLKNLGENEKESFILKFCKPYIVEPHKNVGSAKSWFCLCLFEIMDFIKERGKIIGPTDKIVKYLNDNFEKEISLKTLAEEFHFNPCYISDMFKINTGINFHEYLTALRIKKSIELLNDSRLKIYDIAKMVGYVNVNHFNRVFKKNIGMSPGDYRKKLCI